MKLPRLAFSVTAVTVLTLGAAFAIVGYAINRSQEKQLDEALLVEASEEAMEAAAIGGRKLNISDRPGPAADDIGHLTKYAAIYDTDGRVVAETETFRGKPPTWQAISHQHNEAFDWTFAREHLRCVLVAVPQFPGSTLLLGAPRFDLDRDAAFLRRSMLLVLFGASVWASALVAWVVRRFTRDHQSIAAVVRRVADGDLSARVDEHLTAEVARLGSDVNQMIERLSLLLAAQQQFIAQASHELRSPLTTLYGELSHALRRSRDADAYRGAIEESLESASRLKMLAEDLLALARIGAPAEDPHRAIALPQVIGAAVYSIAAEAQERGVIVQVEGYCGSVAGSARDLERLFRNLLENAIRHSPRGAAVEVTLGEQEGFSVATVADSGPGIAESDRERIFEPFYRGPQARASEIQGVGLGLAIARKIARAQGGDVTLDPERARGARFVVRLSTSRRASGPTAAVV
jgi:signal transduction histidine kinase